MTGQWRVDTPGADPENRRWFPTEAEAVAKRDELKRGGARYVVVWEWLGDECRCPPCPGRGNDGHGLTHCAECCFGTGVEVEYGCPTHAPESAEDARGIAGMPTVALGSIRRLLGRQIEETRSA